MGAVTASGAKQQRQSYNSKRGEEELLKVLHFFVWRLKHSSNTNTPPSSSLNEQIADWSKCWMIMAEDGCVGFAGWYHGFPLVSPAQPSVPEPCVVPKGLSVCWIRFLCFSSTGIWMWSILDGRNAEEARLIVIESGWAAATWGMRESRGGNKSHYYGARVGCTPTLSKAEWKRRDLLTAETMFLFKNK